MSIDMSQFYQTFFEESFEGLDIMESGLLGLDVGAADAETVNTIFRAAHSIKGGSGTFGFTAVADFTHVMETLLDEMRAGTRMVTKEAVDLLLVSVDVLREMLTAVQNEDAINEERVSSIKTQLEVLLNGGAVEEVASVADDTNAAPEASSVSGWYVTFKPFDYLLTTGNDPVRILRELSLLGDYSVKVNLEGLPLFENFDPESCYLSWHAELTGDIEKEKIIEIFEWVDEDCELIITAMGGEAAVESVDESTEQPLETTQEVSEPAVDEEQSESVVEEVTPSEAPKPTALESTEVAKPTAAKAKAAPKSSGESGSIRVSIDKVDALINMVGELVITQSMLGQLGENIDTGKLEKLQDGLAQLERNTRELQESVMRIRMMPISFAFQRFPRMVRDLSSKLNKEIELRLLGEQTELDKTVMEKIGDPLVHLVRNSIDHGIETPEEREAQGKSRAGVVELNAFHQGGNIVIEITDDGKGIDKEVIFNKAVEKGLISETDVLADEQIFDLIFAPGFSTAKEISDVSGRGVGMDVVKRNIRELGGNIEVQSTQGQGSKITIRLPLTLAILDGQLVRVGNDTYIVPLVSIIESLQVKQEQVNAIAAQAELYKLRDDYIPIVRLYDVFNLKPDSVELTDGLIVIVEGDGSKAGLYVDDLLGQQQVVIKSLETNYRPVEGVSGATILGDGTVALILDISGLIELSRRVRDRAA